MYQLISVDRDTLDIAVSFYESHDMAESAMIEDIMISTGYESYDEIKTAAEKGECGLSSDGAWADSHQCGTCQWKIMEIPS